MTMRTVCTETWCYMWYIIYVVSREEEVVQ
jgi:hypothetical protein